MSKPNRSLVLAGGILALLLVASVAAQDQSTTHPATLHPALFLVGDSIMKTATGNGERGPWGWGSEIISFFDPAKIHVYNEGRGGRSSRGYIEEGAWQEILAQLQRGDFVIIQFGHNDGANSQNYPDRISVKGNGDATEEIESAVTHQKKLIHSYGWYLRQYVRDAKTKGATIIICSPAPRNTWLEGHLKRGFDGYAQWAAEAAKQSGALFLDLNTLAADRYDALGQEGARPYFNDLQHTTKFGARVNAEAVVDGLKQLRVSKLTKALATNVPAPAPAPKLQLFEVKGNQDEQQDSANTPRTGKVLLVLAGDSTVTYSAGYAGGLRSHFDRQLQVVNLSRGGRTTATFRSDGRWQQMLDLKPDYVLIQFGHNDEGVMTTEVYAANLGRYVDEARAAGIKPILATPISRRYWRDDGRIHSELGPYVEAMKQVAAAKQVPLMDLHARAIEFYERVGQKVTDTWSFTKPNPALARGGDPAKLPATVLDYTHFNPEGSRAVGFFVADELRKAVPELAKYIY